VLLHCWLHLLRHTNQQLLHEGVEQFLLEVFLRLRLKLVAQHPTPGLVGHVALAVRFVAAVLRKGLLTPVLTDVHRRRMPPSPRSTWTLPRSARVA